VSSERCAQASTLEPHRRKRPPPRDRQGADSLGTSTAARPAHVPPRARRPAKGFRTTRYTNDQPQNSPRPQRTPNLARQTPPKDPRWVCEPCAV